jgi:hypothetical protein
MTDIDFLDNKNIESFVYNYYKHSQLNYTYKYVLLDKKETLVITVKSSFITETLIFKKNLYNQFELINKLFLD